MAKSSYRVRLVDIRGEIAGIQDLISQTDYRTFTASWMMKRAVQQALLIIAEAAKHIPQSLKDQHSQVPWREIHGLGNLLRHEYRRIDPEILWSIMTENLSILDNAAAAKLAKNKEKS